jgi:hypothetical protein
MSKIIIHSKDIGYSASKSPIMKKLLSNPKIARVLDTATERNQIFNKLNKYKSGGFTIKEAQETFRDLKIDSKDAINPEETRVIANEVIPYGKKYAALEKNKEKEDVIHKDRKEWKTSTETGKKLEQKENISGQHQPDETNANPNLNQQAYGKSNTMTGKRNIYNVIAERRTKADLH